MLKDIWKAFKPTYPNGHQYEQQVDWKRLLPPGQRKKTGKFFPWSQPRPDLGGCGGLPMSHCCDSHLKFSSPTWEEHIDSLRPLFTQIQETFSRRARTAHSRRAAPVQREFLSPAASCLILKEHPRAFEEHP
jgi:hypothetical protein